jgi:hypothetical protein
MKRTLIKCLIFAIAAIASRAAFAADAQTNWNWLTFSMNIEKTNLCVGDSIPVSVTVSNVSTQTHMVPWYHGDPCNYGMGHFEIMYDNSSVPCRLSPDSRVKLAHYYLTSLTGGESKTFEGDLVSGYDMTNSGDYTVRAIGWFDEHDTATNHHDVAVTTPKIVISLKSKSGTNSPTR